MNLIVSQAIVLVVIVVLFLITFIKDKSKISVKEMALVTIFCVLTAILYKVIAIKFPPAQPVFIISVSSAVAMSIGILFKPKLALIAGLLIDIIGLLLAAMVGEASMPFLGFTLTMMLTCYIPSVLVRVTKRLPAQVLNVLSILAIVIGVGIASFYLLNATSISIDQNANELTDTLRYGMIFFLVAISILIIIINLYVAKRLSHLNPLAISTAHLTFIIIVVEIICHITLTTLWINIMYEIPFVVASIMRIIKAIFILPINLVIITLILKYIPNTYKQHLLKEKN